MPLNVERGLLMQINMSIAAYIALKLSLKCKLLSGPVL
jgi:hypothetical protein